MNGRDHSPVSVMVTLEFSPVPAWHRTEIRRFGYRNTAPLRVQRVCSPRVESHAVRPRKPHRLAEFFEPPMRQPSLQPDWAARFDLPVLEKI